MSERKAVVLSSGGIDSTTTLPLPGRRVRHLQPDLRLRAAARGGAGGGSEGGRFFQVKRTLCRLGSADRRVGVDATSMSPRVAAQRTYTRHPRDLRPGPKHDLPLLCPCLAEVLGRWTSSSASTPSNYSGYPIAGLNSLPHSKSWRISPPRRRGGKAADAYSDAAHHQCQRRNHQ